MASWTMARKLQRARSWYAARVSLDRTQMQVDDNLVNLGLGKAGHGGDQNRRERSVPSSTTRCRPVSKHEGLKIATPIPAQTGW